MIETLPSADAALDISPIETDLLTAGLMGSLCVWSIAEAGRGRGTAGKGGTISLSVTGAAPGGRGGGRLLAWEELVEGCLIPGRRDLSPAANRCLRRSGKDDFLIGP